MTRSTATAKDERIQLPVSRQFKRFCEAEAAREGVSVAELIRRRVERAPSPEEVELAALTQLLNTAVAETRASVARNLAEIDSVLIELRAARAERELQQRERADA